MKLIHATAILLALFVTLENNYFASCSSLSHVIVEPSNNNEQQQHASLDASQNEIMTSSGDDQDLLDSNLPQQDDQDDFLEFKIKSILAREKYLPIYYGYYGNNVNKRSAQYAKRPFNPQTSK